MFFKLPLEEKKKKQFDPNALEGYGRPFPVPESVSVDWSDSLTLRLYPPQLQNLHLWPSSPQEFRYMFLNSLIILKKVSYYYLSENGRYPATDIIYFLFIGSLVSRGFHVAFVTNY